jgi:dihydrofolate reductase
MRKIFSFHVVSADGYYEGPNQEFDWPVVDEEFDAFSVEQLDEAGTLMFGRRTYELMASYWPTPAAEQDGPQVAERMNKLPKIVVSRTLDRADWVNTRVASDIAQLHRLKQEPGGDILILGSSALAVELIHAGLLDEARIMVNPVVLGAGRSLFHNTEKRIGLKMLTTRTFASGNVLLTYQPAAR